MPQFLPARFSPCCLSLVFLLHFANAAKAEFPVAELTSLSQSAGQVGSEIDIKPLGKYLDELSNIITSEGLVAEVDRLPPQLLQEEALAADSFRLWIGEDCIAGLKDVRTLGRFGISNPRRFLVTSKPLVSIRQEHTNRIQAVDLQLGSIYEERFLSEKRNFYRVELEQGQQIRCVCYSRQIDSQAVPQLLVIDPAGREIVRSRGRGIWPAKAEWKCAETGEYLIATHDFLFRGGEEYRSLLECVIVNSPNNVGVCELDQLLRPTLIEEANAYAFPSPTRINSPIADRSQSLESLFEHTGMLTDEGFESTIDFSKGQKVWIDVESHQLSQLTDPKVSLFSVGDKGERRQVFSIDDPRSLGKPDVRLRLRDPSFEWTSPATASYTIRVDDNQRGTNLPKDARGFRISVRESKPSFRLLAFHAYPNSNVGAAKPFGNVLHKGGKSVVRVLASRFGNLDGAIRLKAKGLPDHIYCPDAIIPPGSHEACLILSASPDAKNWQGPISIVGSIHGDADREVVAQYATTALNRIPTRNSTYVRLSDQINFAVVSADSAPLDITLDDGRELKVVQGEKLTIPIQLRRSEQGKVACILRPQNLPANCTVADVSIAAKDDSSTLTLQTKNNIQPGEYTFWTQTEAKLKWNPNPQAIRAAEQYLEKLKLAQNAPDPSTSKAKLDEAITLASKRVAELKKKYAAQNLTVWIPSNLVRFQVIKPSGKEAKK